jgi:hypothetical protein
VLEVRGPPTQRVFTARAPSAPLPAKRNVIYYESVADDAVFELRLRAAP